MAAGLNPAVAYAAGVLTILSPCVLPLVPIVLGSAAQGHRWGPLALMGGLVVSFTLTGFALAALGTSSGIDSEIVRLIGAIMLLLIGLVLIVPKAQDLLGRMTSPLAAWAGGRQAGFERFGVAGQAAIGSLLGLVWSPCIGPTLGAATVLAAQRHNLTEAAVVMAAFGIGIATALLAISLAARSALSRWRARIMEAAENAKKVLGALVVAVSLMIITGLDRILEGVLVEISPQWLTDLTTAI